MKFWSHQDTGPRARQEDAILVRADGLAIVCDGMGGHQAGDRASRLALEAFVASIDAGLAAEDALGEAVASLEDAVFEHPELRDMGTTLTALLVNEDRGQARVLHVGDCRIYLFQHASGGFEGRQLTVDHGHGHRLSRFLPDEAFPDVFEVGVSAGDRLLLCSDGVSDVLGLDALLTGVRADQPAEQIVEMALERGTFDNASAIVLAIESRAEPD